MIKSHLLYQLSYGVMIFLLLQRVSFAFALQSYGSFFEPPNFFEKNFKNYSGFPQRTESTLTH